MGGESRSKDDLPLTTMVPPSSPNEGKKKGGSAPKEEDQDEPSERDLLMAAALGTSAESTMSKPGGTQKEPKDKLHIFWHRDGILAFFPIVGDRWRVVADLGVARGGEKRADPTLDEVNALLKLPDSITNTVWRRCA